MKARLLGQGPVEDFRAIFINVPEHERALRKCWRCGNEFDLRRANRTEWICGECIAIYRGGQVALDSYIASHPRHYARNEHCKRPRFRCRCSGSGAQDCTAATTTPEGMRAHYAAVHHWTVDLDTVRATEMRYRELTGQS